MLRKLSTGHVKRLSQAQLDAQEEKYPKCDAASVKRPNVHPTSDASSSKKDYVTREAASAKKSMIPVSISRANSVERESHAKRTASGSRIKRRSISAESIPQLLTTPVFEPSRHVVSSSSVYRGRHPALLSSRKPVRKDTRPLGDKQFQNAALSKVRKFLQMHHTTSDYVPLDVSSRKMTLKMFVEITDFLLRKLFPTVCITSSNYTEEIPMLMKKLRYPGVIARSWLLSANTSHSWPQVLGLMSWLVSILDFNDEFVYQETDDEIVDVAVFQELVECIGEDYVQFCCEGCFSEDQLNGIQQRALMKHAIKEEEVQGLKQEIEVHTQALNNSEDLLETQEMQNLEEMVKHTNALVESELQQNNQLTEQIMSCKNQDKSLQEQIKRQEYEVQQMKQMIEQLQITVNNQTLSVQEKDKMTVSALALKNMIAAQEKQFEEINKVLYKDGLNINRQRHQLSAQVLKYNSNFVVEQPTDLINTNNVQIELATSDTECLQKLNLVKGSLDEMIAVLNNQLWQADENFGKEVDKNQMVKEQLEQVKEELIQIVCLAEKEERILKSKKNDLKTEETNKLSQISAWEEKCANLIVTDSHDLALEKKDLEQLKQKHDNTKEMLEYILQEGKICLEGVVKIFAASLEERERMENKILHELLNDS